METKILLGGGGSAEDEQPVLQRFASWIGREGSLLYLPVAMADPGQAQFDWISGALDSLGAGQIEMWTDMQQHDPTELARYDGIFIGGGNTYHLLNELRTAGFIQALVDFANSGRALYGGSAGAILIGRDIATCAHMDENIVGISDTRGLDLVHGRAIWCHYTPADAPLIRAYTARAQISVIALSETSGLWIQGPDQTSQLGSPPVLYD